MRWYLARRVAASILTLFLATIVVFFGVRALPGGPAVALSAESNDPAVVAAIQHKYHLDEPVVSQYGHWLGLALTGDLGDSPLTKLSVSSVLANRIPVTAELTLLALIIGLLIGVPAGVLAAVRPGKFTDYLASGVALGGLSIPHFWFGIVLILLLAVHLHFLPAAGFVPILSDPVSNLLHMLMPAFVLGAGLAAVIMRQTRSAMLESLGADYVRTARAKGLSEWRVVAVHALRNSLVTVVTVFGLQLGALIGGVVTIEQVFDIPGIGKLTLDSVFQRDYPTLQGVVLLTAAAYIVVNLLVDLTYSVINPRIRVTGAAA
ncbi:MAG TPA: ABC transporter permease [Mycobacteriales bacterium]|nr:ABC transporter permease [Mycobacteriales bacterium]